MKRFLILVMVLLGFQMAKSHANDMKTIRVWYYKAINDHGETVALMTFLEKEAHTPVLDGYRAATQFLLADQSHNYFTKWKYFRHGKSLLENALKQEPDNIELRFIRFCIQTNVPSFLHYSGQIAADKRFLLDAVKNNEIHAAELKAGFLQVFQSSHALNSTEKAFCEQRLR